MRNEKIVMILLLFSIFGGRARASDCQVIPYLSGPPEPTIPALDRVTQSKPKVSALSYRKAQAATETPFSPLAWRTIRARDFGYQPRSPFTTFIVRLASNCPLTMRLRMPGLSTPSAELHSPTASLPLAIRDLDTETSELQFEIPAGPGLYYLKSDARWEDDPAAIETFVFWIDDLAATKPAADAIQVLPGESLQAAIDHAKPRDEIALAPGLHRAASIQIKKRSGLSLFLHPDAVLEQESGNKDFITIEDSEYLRIRGAGEIRTLPGNQGKVIHAKRSKRLNFQDFFLYKTHHEDGWSIHMFESEDILLKGIKVISGNDASDPDSSKRILYDQVYLESQDDAVAVKSRGNGSCEEIYFQNGFAKSAASALKVGEATVRHLIDGVTFRNSTIFDSDRAMIVTPKGPGRIGSILYEGIRVRNMEKNRHGATIMVLRSQETELSVWEGADIRFQGIDAEVIEPMYLEPQVWIKDSIFHVRKNTADMPELFPDTLPISEGLSILHGE